jgi:hypothetical protein
MAEIVSDFCSERQKLTANDAEALDRLSEVS